MSSLRIFLLGSPHIELDGEAVAVDRRKAIALIAYLAVTAQAHSRDALATLLWPELDQTRARAALRRTLSVINKALAGQYLLTDRETITLQRNAGLWTDLSQFQQHLTEYREHEPQADEVRPESLALLTEAVALYRGDFMAGFTLRDSSGFDEWQFFETERLRRELAGALALLSGGYRTLGDYELALAYARQLLELDPLNEATHRALMELYAWTDQRPAALRQYQECARILEHELGIAPSESTTTLFERIRAGRLDLPASLPDGTAGQSPADSEFANGGDVPASPRLVSSASSPLPSETDVPVDPRAPFVARERELTQLTGYLETIISGRGQIVLITGDAGSGKTALIHEFARRAQQTVVDLIAASGSCNSYTGLGDPYLPFREILALLTGDVEAGWLRGAISHENATRLRSLLPVSTRILLEDGPDLIDSFVSGSALAARVAAAASGHTAELQRLRQQHRGQLGQQTRSGRSLSHEAPSHLLEQFTEVLQSLAKQKPLLLAIDDAQWADAASLELLFHLSRRLRHSRVLLLITYRPDDLAVERPLPGSKNQRLSDSGRRHPLEPLINEIRRIYGEIRIDLDQAMDRQFIDAFVDIEPNQLGQEFRSALYQKTQGHPLFTVELLREMQARKDIVRDEHGRWTEAPALDWDTLPARVEAVINERIGRLDDELREILTLASVEGRTFTAQLIAYVQGLDQRLVLRTLSQELDKRYHLVTEQGEVHVGARYLSEYQFAHTLFQQYLYNALSVGEKRMRHGDVALALEHLYQGHTDEITVQLAHHFAEAGQMEQALGYLLRAGDTARGLYAHDEAVGFYQRALAFLKEKGDYERAARTLMKLGLTHHLALNFRQARQAYAEGFSLWQRAGMSRPTSLPAASASAPHPLRLAGFNPPTLDPTMANDDSSSNIIRQLFSGLVLLNQELDVVPELAHSWEVLEGGSSYVFRLRTDETWSDGQPVTAEDFVYAWRRILDPTVGSPNASYLYDIEGARAYHQGEMSDREAIGVRALDASTLAVNLEGPTGHFPQLLAQWMMYPVPQHVVEAYGEAWTTGDRIVTNGPFELAQWQPGALMTFERSARYRGRYNGNVQQVELSLNVGSGAELVRMYETDRLDMMQLFLTLEEEWVRQRHAEEYFSGPTLHTQYVGFNVRKTPFNDARVRRAFALAIDQETLTNVTQFGYQFPALGGFVPPGMPGHSAQIGLPFDPAQARQLLAEAGYPSGRGFPKLRGLINAAQEIEGAYLRDQWLEVLGVTVEWQTIDWDQLLSRLEESPPHLFRVGWGIDYPDPDNPLRVGASNLERATGWRNETYVRLVEEARRTTDQDIRLRMYQQADKMLVEDAAIVPLAYGRQHMLVKPWVRRFSYSTTNWQSWKDIVIEPH